MTFNKNISSHHMDHYVAGYMKFYLFQQIIVDMSTNRISFEIKVDVHIFPKPTRVVISVCFGITKGF